jgi:neutral trehalase
VLKTGFPIVHFYDQDFVDIYNKTWTWLYDFWKKGTKKNGFQQKYFNFPENTYISQYEVCLSSFFLVYSNNIFSPYAGLDNLYSKQEESGAIRGIYNEEDGLPIFTEDNPECLHPPLFSWVEFNLYHKIGQKKRLKEIIPILEKYYKWVEDTFQKENGLYATPLSSVVMDNTPRDGACYLIDFNAMQAINALYLSAIGDILNDKEISFRYKKKYFSLKTRINSLLWYSGDNFYYDLDANGNFIKEQTIATFWTLLAEIPNEDRANALIDKLSGKEFGTENPFPSVSTLSNNFCEDGNRFRGSVFPHLTFMIIKGLEKYARNDLARECSIRHLYYILDTFHPDEGRKGGIYEAYLPSKEGSAKTLDSFENFPRENFLTYTALSTIALMIENVIGLYISLPRKTVDWIVPTLEIMGIEDLSLKRNMITILGNKSGRGWEIRLESEKLYYFTINIIGVKKKTLPIPSGKCSMLIDKL